MIVQRCGTDVNGGAEAHCREVAKHMTPLWDVTILTTTALDYETWKPHYAPGPQTIEDIPAIRFNVDAPRDKRAFDHLSKQILKKRARATLTEQEEWMRAQGPYSTPLLRYIEDNEPTYDLFIFYSYLYATTYFALPLVSEKAFLAPLAHDEWPIHFTMWNNFFRKPQRTLFNTPEERNFLTTRFPNAALTGPIVGVGITPPLQTHPDHFRERYNIKNPFCIYVGRIDKAKQTDTLLKNYAAYCRQNKDNPLDLILLGRSVMNIPHSPGVHALGYVNEEDKFDAIAASGFLIMPSNLESLSMSVLEAWSTARPTLVNAASPVLVGQTTRANAGLCYTTTSEFITAIQALRNPETQTTLGANGLRYVKENYAWPTIINTYAKTYEDFASTKPQP